jgi:hypothetical protein
MWSRRLARTRVLLGLESFVLEQDVMGDDVVCLDEIETLGDDRVVLEVVFAHGKEDFDHVLGSLVERIAVEDVAVHLEDAVIDSGRRFGKQCADLAGEGDGDLDAVVGRTLDEEREDLQGEDL